RSVRVRPVVPKAAGRSVGHLRRSGRSLQAATQGGTRRTTGGTESGITREREGRNARAAAKRPFSLCAQHGRDLGGGSPPVSWPQRTKRSATARGRPSVGRKHGAKPRADGQEPDTSRCRAGRAG